MSLKPKSMAMWAVVPLLAMSMIACGDDEEVPANPFGPGTLCGNGKIDGKEECDDGNLNPQDECTSICTEAICGDGVVQRMAEDCDDGNRVNDDGCSNDCEPAACGNGVKEPGEACDGGAGCTDQCALGTCGDGVVQAGEDCDDGDRDDTDACTTKCLAPECGDGVVQDGEECDDGSSNSDNGPCTEECEEAECGDGLLFIGVEACDPGEDDECRDDCAPKDCGDGVLQAGEACDDGNMSNNDGCSNTCFVTTCGDGFVQTGEECDDGNLNPYDDCLNDCTAPECGDGIVHNQGSGSETCDDGDENGPFPALCSPACQPSACGNGVIDQGEECDDEDENGENASCLPTCLWNSCGDGFAYLSETDGTNNPNDLEECDDENTDNEDACINTCAWNTCGDGFQRTKAYDDEYDSDEDGNPEANSPFPEVEECDDGDESNNDGCIRTAVTFGGEGEGGPIVQGYLCSFNRCGDGQAYTSKTATDGNPFPEEDCDDSNTSNTDSCLNSCEFASCQDGYVYASVTIPANPASVEECDDGNDSSSDACTATCEDALCGDGFVWRGHESCDDAVPGTGAECDGCVLESCGNGDLDDGEECDDGTDDGGVGEDGDDNDSCLETCQWNSCGDGFRYMAVTEGGAGQNTARIEACDDGNGIDTDSCISSCEWADCTDGNPYIDVTVPARNDEGWEDAMEDAVAACPEGYQESAICDVDEDHPGDDGPCDDGGYTMDECSPPNGPEQCDDGNGTESDSCLSSCEFNDCLDGEVYTTLTDPQNLNPLEQCDDGIASADCTASCTPTRCGDGIISEEAGETCDPEHPDFEENPDDCRADCVLESCGNEVVDDREDCDDGNDDNNDACPNNCIAPRCGDGIVQASLGEDCDDGNTDPTDACTNACLDADCGDGIRQAGVEECDYGVPVGSENGAPNDDGFVDTDGFCTDQCVVQCFQNPAIAWADEYQGNCVFVPEQNWASNDLDYQDISMCGCEDGTPLADVPDVNGDCFCPDGPDEGTAPDPGFLLPDFSSFLSAASYCENLGLDAHLVKIDSQAKNELVMDLINAATAAEVFDPLLGDIGYEDFLETLVNPYWIGLADEHTTQADPEGLWTWYPDATDEVDNSLTNLWLSGQPDDADDDVATPGQEDCGAMYGLDDEGDDDSGGWADHSCGAAFRFVCEFPMDQSP